MEFRKVWISFVLIGLFVFALLSFIVQFQSDNEQEENILGNSIINETFKNLETNLSNFSSTSQSQKDNFESEVPSTSFGSLIIFSIVSSGKIFSGLLIGIYNILIILPASIFGVSQVVIGVASSVLVFSIILLLWRLYKTGE